MLAHGETLILPGLLLILLLFPATIWTLIMESFRKNLLLQVFFRAVLCVRVYRRIYYAKNGSEELSVFTPASCLRSLFLTASILYASATSNPGIALGQSQDSTVFDEAPIKRIAVTLGE